ncbi:MAG: cell envelope integrity protein TolA [Erysipelotrichaceae bacterium]|nr:cell envelope integrity protein TolA [Erysipelotrichaceae bacterium]
MKQEVKKDAKAAAVETKAVQPVKEAEKALKPTETKITVKVAAKKEAVKEATKDNKALKTAAKEEVKKPAAAKKAESKTAKKEAVAAQEANVKADTATKVEKASAKAEKTAKKETAKPAAAKTKEVKAVEKKAEAKVAKASAKKAVAKTVDVKKEEAKKTKEAKTAVKKTAKATKPTAKKATAKKADSEKLDQYAVRSLTDCINDMKKMQVQYDYEDYYRLLLDEPDLKKLASNIIEGNHIKENNYDYKELGYDMDLVAVTLEKVAETMEVKAADFKEYKKAITKSLRFKMSGDAEANAAEYLDEFKLAEKLLMIGQRKNITDAEVLSDTIGADVNEYFKHFFELAYDLLPSWQYDDVKFYENFAYAVLSQFNDLYQSEQQRIQIDVADLYIKHGDYQLGDEMYGYILRDNQIKDYIYYRYASVYKDIDFNKAKSIAYSSFQYVDDRYTYYPNILEIANQ